MIKAPTNSAYGQGSLPGLQTAPYSLCSPTPFPLCACRESPSVSPSFIKTLMSSEQSQTLMT